MTDIISHTDTILTCILLTLLLPLVSFIFSFLIYERYSWLASLSASVLLLVSTICSFYVLTTSWNKVPILFSFHWFNIGTSSLSANLSLSNTSMLMLALVSVISFLVHVYSIGYMAGDPEIKKYFAMLGFFTFSMQGIVLADNLLLLFIFWELVGFSSYMLIGHWMDKPQAARAAQKAFVINRIGDAGFMVGLMIIWANIGSFDLTQMLQLENTKTWQTAASLCIFCGVMGKSAQFPLFTWLPDAMEGPTPVSALIHAATMVAAGVYLVIRVFPLFTPIALTLVATIGMITAIIGSLAALFQYDIKKILAYSTISQLGTMIMALGMGSVNAALLHLFTHAFFKACLFLCAGSVIHSLHQAQRQAHQHFDVQDIRLMGGLRKKLPVTFLCFLTSAASLAGIPFFSGFLSKEAILVSAWTNANSFLPGLILITFVGVSFITTLYAFRLIWYTFMGQERNQVSNLVLESPIVMRAPIILLACCSLWFIVSPNPVNFFGWLFPEAHYPNLSSITLFSILWIVVALILGYYIFRTEKFRSKKIFENVFHFDSFTQNATTRFVKQSSMVVTYIDKKWIDGVIHGIAYVHVTIAHFTGWIDRVIIDGSVNGLAYVSQQVGSLTRSFQGGKIQVYIFWSILAIIIFLIWTLN